MDDIADTLAPKSNQLDNIDLVAGPRIFTVESVDVDRMAEQSVTIHLAEFDRPWKPAVTMRRVLAECWGLRSAGWVGKRVELYREPDVTYGKETPGGTRIKRVSGITSRKVVDIMLTRGRMGKYTVEPLPDAPASAEQTADSIADCEDVAILREWWQLADSERRALIQARVQELTDKETDR